MLESPREQCYKTECQDPPPDLTTCSQGEMESCLRFVEVPKKSKQGHRGVDQQALSLPPAPGKTLQIWVYCKLFIPTLNPGHLTVKPSSATYWLLLGTCAWTNCITCILICKMGIFTVPSL